MPVFTGIQIEFISLDLQKKKWHLPGPNCKIWLNKLSYSCNLAEVRVSFYGKKN